MKGTILGKFIVISLVYALALVPSAQAYQYYDDGAGNGCVQCHTGFQNGNQNVLHFIHLNGMGIQECNACHPAGGGSTPVETYWSGTGGGLGCAGCHGRDYGETSPNSGLMKASAYGLRQHHANNGVNSCQGCHSAGSNGHSNPLPVIKAENVAPPYYGTGISSLGDPCSSDQEDTSVDVDLLGLDNDGDTFRDWPDDVDCPMPTTTTSTTTTTLPLACEAAPSVGCVSSGKGSLSVDEKKEGKEKLKVGLKKMTSGLGQSNFGDPVFGDTDFAVCIYDALDVLVGEFLVERPGAQCGTKPCWSAVSTKGYKYGDKDASADGITKMSMKGGDAGKGSVAVGGKNNASKGQMSLPTGIAAALSGNEEATVQVLTSDASCFGATTTNVKTADGVVFKASGP